MKQVHCFQARGVIIIARPVSWCKVFRIATKNYCKLLAISVRGCILFGAYLSPHISKDNLEEALSWICRAASGPALAMGDFNERRKECDFHTNPRGAALRFWCDKFGWTLHASNSSTSITAQGCRTIEIALTKNLDISKPYVHRGK